MNLPNKITIFRVILIPFFVFFILTDFVAYSDYLAATIFIVGSLSDALDGYIARKYHLITNFGKFMDPLADKLLVSSAMICMIALERIPAWAVIIIISRDFIINGFRLVASDNGVVIAAGWWGKVKTTVQMIMSILLIIHIENPIYQVIEQIFIYLAVTLTVISLIDYIYKNRQVLKN